MINTNNMTWERYKIDIDGVISTNKYSRTAMARTHLVPCKYVRERGSSSKRVLIIPPGQEA